jgi:hypothetical protein
VSTVSTATIETLTAEVRVLMVGSRQVTLSVARQLDWVELERIAPFGRVKLGDGNAVIGRDEAGSLVLARYVRHLPGPYITRDDLVAPILVPWICGTSRDLRLRWREGVLIVDSSETERCACPMNKCTCSGWSANGNPDAVFDRITEEHQRKRELHQAATKLPLIVLAGLK